MKKNYQQRKVLGEDVALARYAVIAPLVCREMSAVEQAAEVRRLCSMLHRFPEGQRRVSRRNVRRWCAYYRQGRPPKMVAGPPDESSCRMPPFAPSSGTERRQSEARRRNGKETGSNLARRLWLC